MNKAINKSSINKCAKGAAAILLTALLTACGEKSPEVTSVSIDKDGAVTNVIYEEFDKDYYDVSELESMVGSEIDSYNSEFISPRITLDGVELIDDGAFVKVSMTFKDASDFSSFNEEKVFYGTIEEAIDAGYEVSKGLVDRGGDALSEDFLDEHKDNHIGITTDKANFITPYKIRYMSKGVVLLSDKEAVLEDTTGESVQLLLTK